MLYEEGNAFKASVSIPECKHERWFEHKKTTQGTFKYSYECRTFIWNQVF